MKVIVENGAVMPELSSPVRDFVDAVNAHDEQGFLDAFADPGVVDDWGREFVGREAIKGWSDKEFIGAQGTMEVQQVDVRDDGRVIVVADWRSNHANGLSEFGFDVEGDAVTRLTIRAPSRCLREPAGGAGRHVDRSALCTSMAPTPGDCGLDGCTRHGGSLTGDRES